ncbi:ferritin-like domain-containing protein [Hoylesella oralis]|uniref:ferritin-like domain-containing protein n=1 Tax=Hoylesella oralis TaxID=28134 RepID=UPI0028E24C7E|nr:ferritin-like domain-containing protein [Hoylesella oralis]
MNTKKSIERLNFYANALNQQAYQHRIQGKIFASQGFEKLGDKYSGHATEETEWTNKFLDRILDLGGTPSISASQGLQVYNNIKDYLQVDKDTSIKGMDFLRKDMLEVSEDITTFDILKDYLKDEEEDLYWTEQQIELIEHIGLQNWLVKQL